MLELINVEAKIISDFECAIADLEALSAYYTETSKLIKTNKIEINSKYKIAIEISNILDEIYLKEKDDRAAYILEIQEKVLSNNIKLKDVMEVNVKEDGNITFSLQDKYAKDKYNPAIAKKRTNYILNQESIFIRSILSNLIIAFEQFFSSQYEIIVLLSPQKYFGEKTVSFCDLLEGNLEELIKSI